MDVAIVIFLFLSLIVLAIWFVPVVIAYKRDHLNKHIILILSLLGLVLSIYPFAGLAIWTGLLIWSLYKSKPTVEKVQVEKILSGPQGDRGHTGPVGESAYEIYVRLAKEDNHEYVMTEREWINSLRGKDADELPISKAGVVKPRAEY